MKYITLRELKNITGLNVNTLNVYLCRSNFTKYYFKKDGRNIFILNTDFIKNLIDLLLLRHHEKEAEKLNKFWIDSGHKQIVYKNEENENELKIQLEILTKHYDFLLKRYNEVIAINKELTSKLEK